MSDTTEAMRAAFDAWAVTLLSDNPTWRESAPCELAWQAWQAALAHLTPAAPAATDSTHTGAVTTDQLIELTAHLERKRAAAIVEDVRVLPIGGHDADAPTQFQAGFALACEEIAHRLQTEAWGMLPNGGFGPTGAANEDDRPSPEFPELLRRALAAQPSPERNDCEPVANLVESHQIEAWNEVWCQARALGTNRGLGELLTAVEAYGDARAAGSTLGVHTCTVPEDDDDGWMPIETAPRNGKPVLVFAPGERSPAYIAHWLDWKPDRSRTGWQVNGHLVHPTHWRPLPQPPAAATKEPQQ